MNERKALIVWGGWDGHEPEAVADLFADILRSEGFVVQVENSLDAFIDKKLMAEQTLLVPIWTMGEISAAQRDPVLQAVAERGVGLAGCHGGMCDAFRMDTEWQLMTGGQWVAHPGDDGVRYAVEIRDAEHPITKGLETFEVVTEQYGMHVDPANHILATTPYPVPGVRGADRVTPCAMPVVWTKTYGKGRVFFNAVGHRRNVLETGTPRELMRRGFLWADKVSTL